MDLQRPQAVKETLGEKAMLMALQFVRTTHNSKMIVSLKIGKLGITYKKKTDSGFNNNREK